MKEKIDIGKIERRQRSELTLPPITFHHIDSWRKTLGKGAFDAWLVLYTLADRHTYPDNHVIHNYNYEKIAEHFQCKRDKAVELIKTLYEYGLLEICETKNKFGGVKNVYVWCDVPFYSKTQFCQLEKRRRWEDRNSEGQEIALKQVLARKKRLEESLSEKSIDEESLSNMSTGSLSEKPTGLRDQPVGKIDREPIGKIDKQPVGKTDYINNTNNNNSNNNKLNHLSFHPLVSKSMKVDQPNTGNKEGLREDKMENKLINQQQLEEDVEVVKKYFYENVSEDKEIVPFLRRWIKETSRDTVLYCIDRLLEQKEVRNSIPWLEKAIKNPEKYPKKIKYTRKDSKNCDRENEKKKMLLRSMYM